MEQHTPQAFQIPVVLYGDAATVRRAWHDVLHQASRGAQWDDLFSSLKLMRVGDDQAAKVLIGDFEGLCERRHKHFRLNWIWESLGDLCVTEYCSRHQCQFPLREYVASGTEHIWFSTALLTPGRVGPLLLAYSQDAEFRTFLLDRLKCRFQNKIPVDLYMTSIERTPKLCDSSLVGMFALALLLQHYPETTEERLCAVFLETGSDVLKTWEIIDGESQPS